MKRLFFTAFLIISISSVAVARVFVASGKSFTALGDYKIEIADKPFAIDGKEYKTYIISYQNSPLELTVFIRKGNNCQNYIVLSEKLSIQYVCNDNYFGVEKFDKSARRDGFITSDEALNRAEYFRQKVLCQGRQSEVLNIQLIASFFPMLLEEPGELFAII